MNAPPESDQKASGTLSEDRHSYGTVAASFPLALLEAIQAHDRPLDLLENEDFSTSMPRRLGLTSVVESQIQRFRRVPRGRRVPAAEVRNILLLILRRPDAETILRSAGRELARQQIARPTRPGGSRLLPRLLAQSMVRLSVRRALYSLLGNAKLKLGGEPLTVQVSNALTARLDPAGTGCTLYASVIEEIIFRITGNRTSVKQTCCESRGDACCAWTVVP